jgi:hypothetical protein
MEVAAEDGANGLVGHGLASGFGGDAGEAGEDVRSLGWGGGEGG